MEAISAEVDGQPTAQRFHTSHIPTRYLGGAPRATGTRRTGFSGTLPRVPIVTHPIADSAPLCDEAGVLAHRATQRRRRLLAIFSRMMARFHERHERHWSMGRWECLLCHRRIVAWAWLPLSLPDESKALHEECVSRSMWDVVLHHERMARAGTPTYERPLVFGTH
jgi:hypothetical protein